MTLIRAIREASWPHWIDAAIWLSYNLLGSLAPVWFGFLLLKLFSRHPSWADFSHHGEFALYSAAMFAPAFYIILRDIRIPGFPGRSILGLLCIVGLLFATGFFAAVTTAFMAPTPVLVIDQAFLRWGTLILFVCSALLAFFVNVVENARPMLLDVREITATQRAQLAADFDQLGGGR